MPRHQREAAAHGGARTSVDEALLHLRRFGKHLHAGRRRPFQRRHLRGRGTIGHGLDIHRGRLPGPCLPRLLQIAQGEGMQRQPWRRRACRNRQHLQGAGGRGGGHRARVLHEQATRRGVGKQPVQARSRQQQRAAAFRNQQIAPLHHVVAPSPQQALIGDVFAYPLQAGVRRRLQIQLAGQQRHRVVQPHGHPHRLLHVRVAGIHVGFHEHIRVRAGGCHRRRMHHQPQGPRHCTPHPQRRHLEDPRPARPQAHREHRAGLAMAIFPDGVAPHALSADVELHAQWRIVDGLHALVGGDVERHHLAHGDLGTIQPCPRLRAGRPRDHHQQQAQQPAGDAATHRASPACRRRASSWKRARSNAPGSSGTRCSHA